MKATLGNNPRSTERDDTAGYLSILTTAAVVLFGVVVWTWELPQDKAQLAAAWAQAIGSIVAIYIAYVIGARQSQAALDAVSRAHNLDRRARSAGLFAVVEAAIQHARKIRTALDEPDASFVLLQVTHRVVIDQIIASLTSIPKHDVGNEASVTGLWEMSYQFAFVQTAIDKLHEGSTSQMDFAISSFEHLPEHERKEHLRATRTTRERVLVRNVLTHLGTIFRQFEVLERDLGGEP